MENKLYSDIEMAIIRWTIDGTKTAGSLTREIKGIIKQNEEVNKGTIVDAVKQVMKNQMEEIEELESEFKSIYKFPDNKVKIGPKYTDKNPFSLHNTTTVYRVYDDNDEYDVSKIDTNGTIEWKVESITYSNPHKNSSLYKNLIEYCKGL